MKMNYLKCMLDQQDDPATPTIYAQDNERNTINSAPPETCHMTSLNETKSPAYFGRANDDIIMTDVVSTSPIYPTSHNSITEQNEIFCDEAPRCSFGDSLRLCNDVGSFADFDSNPFHAPRGQGLSHDRFR